MTSVRVNLNDLGKKFFIVRFIRITSDHCTGDIIYEESLSVHLDYVFGWAKDMEFINLNKIFSRYASISDYN